ncbi:MAG: single-stranded DNA-binding protein [Colwellia sp.]|nr:single-stranded DNA-binding protein [Colwellia sp.]
MAGLNRVMLIGNLGKDPEITHSKNGNAIAKFSLATSDGMKDQNGEVKTEWHRIVAFGKTAEVIEKYVKKGSQLSVEGSLSYGSYENKDGVTIYTTDIICRNIVFLGGKNDNQQSNQGQQQRPAPQKIDASQEMDDSQLPF